MTARKHITAIITRTKDRPALFERAVQSVVAQTSKDYIHVILNDGGDKKVVEEILGKYPDNNRLVIHNEKSVGLTPALNQAIKATDSDYIGILDDDDTWLPDRVKKVTDYLDAHLNEPGVAVLMDRFIERVENGEIITESVNPWYEGVTEVSLYDQLLDNYLTNNCITYRRTLYDELNGYDETLEVAEDWDFGIRYLLKYDIFFIPEVLAGYHHRPAAKGADGNSVFSGIDAHRRSLVKLRNRYLRQDINNGVFGVGYIMNSLAHERCMVENAKDVAIEQVVRLEGHINYTAEQLKQYTDTVVHQAKNPIIRKVKKKLKSLSEK